MLTENCFALRDPKEWWDLLSPSQRQRHRHGEGLEQVETGYGHMPHNDVSVNHEWHVAQWSHKVIMELKKS